MGEGPARCGVTHLGSVITVAATEAAQHHAPAHGLAARPLRSAYRQLSFISRHGSRARLWLFIRLSYPARHARWLEQMCDHIAKRQLWGCREGRQRERRLQHVLDFLQRLVEV